MNRASFVPTAALMLLACDSAKVATSDALPDSVRRTPQTQVERAPGAEALRASPRLDLDRATAIADGTDGGDRLARSDGGGPVWSFNVGPTPFLPSAQPPPAMPVQLYPASCVLDAPAHHVCPSDSDVRLSCDIVEALPPSCTPLSTSPDSQFAVCCSSPEAQ
jgi:hypothetical protein